MRKKNGTNSLRQRIALSAVCCCLAWWMISPILSAAQDEPELVYTQSYEASVPGDPIRCGATAGDSIPCGSGTVIIECTRGHRTHYGYTDHDDGTTSCDECGDDDVDMLITHMKNHMRRDGCQAIVGYREGPQISATLEVYSDGRAVLDYQISVGQLQVSFDNLTQTGESGTLEMNYTENGTYHASVYYSNSYQKEWTFTIDTLPVQVRFTDPAGVQAEWSETMYMYREREAVECPTRYGYLFDGYTDESGVKAYSADGNRAINYITLGQMNKTLRLDWKAKTYNVYYTYIQNGTPMYKSAVLTFDSPLPELDVNINGAIENGRVFCGYKLDDLILYDAEGNPLEERLTQELEPVLQHYGNLVLNEIWKPIDLYLFFGSDSDGDGVPDQKLHLTENRYPDLAHLPQRDGYDFRGLEYEGTEIYGQDGTAVDTAIDDHIVEWIRSGENVILDERWERKSWELRYGTDTDGDGLPDGSMTLDYGEQLPGLNALAERDGSEPGEFLGWGFGDLVLWDEDGQPVKETLDTDLDRWKDASGQLVIGEVYKKPANTGSGASAANSSGNGSGGYDEEDDRTYGDGMVRPGDDSRVLSDNEGDPGQNGAGSVSADSAGNDSISANEADATGVSQNAADADAGSDTGNTGREDSDGNRENGGGGSETDGSGDPAGRPDAAAVDPGQTDSEEQPIDAEESGLSEEAEHDGADIGNEEQGQPTESLSTDEQDREIGGETSGDGRSGLRKVMPVVRKAAAAVAVTGGVSFALLAAYMGLVWLTAMAEISGICGNGKVKRLGKLTIQSEKGRAFRVRIPQRFIDECDTGQLRIRIPGIFARHYRKCELIIEAGKSARIERIRREIGFCV